MKRQPYRVFARPLPAVGRFWTWEVTPKHGTRPIHGGPHHSWIGAWLAARREAKVQARVPDVLIGADDPRHLSHARITSL